MVYKLYYFNFAGPAEPIRYLFSYGNIEFEDFRIEHADWPKYKSSMPTGTVPVLEIDGKKIDQSIAIARFIAKKVGLTGSTDLENLEIDSVVYTVNDFKEKITQVAFEQDAALKEKKLKTLNEETIPFYLEKLEVIAKQNNGHLALKRLTWADLFFAALKPTLDSFSQQDLTAKYPNLKKVTEKVLALEGIKKWVAKHP